MADNNGAGEDLTFQAFLEETHKEYEQTQQQLREIDVLIKQSAAEVERLAQRNAQVSNYVRQLQTNFDTIPREDIREGYEAQQNAQQRLFTMRGQLEKLQSDQRNLERLAEFQRRLLDLTEGMGAVPEMRGSRHSRDQSNVIRVVQMEESARQSLVRKMHDGPASSLSNFILQAEICQRFYDKNPDRARAELNALKATAATAFETVKDFIFELRPMMLDDLGVVPTLRRYVETLQEKEGPQLSITVTGMERRLEGHVEITVFRAVQELLNNARQHARATQVQVLLDLAQDRLLAVVEDNGSGFNVEEAITVSETSKTIGLSTIRERIEMLGGELNIQSSLGHGTRAEFSIPLEPEAEIA
ncbi:MAG TPA: sensor histidine kinase [Candidatus Sulfomarinibacteraceae bacterium]|nr:sensor histidine kinase [Candidatus Sulfomarinibacteraceae bacterium]